MAWPTPVCQGLLLPVSSWETHRALVCSLTTESGALTTGSTGALSSQFGESTDRLHKSDGRSGRFMDIPSYYLNCLRYDSVRTTVAVSADPVSAITLVDSENAMTVDLTLGELSPTRPGSLAWPSLAIPADATSLLSMRVS